MVIVIDYGVGNIGSIINMFKRLGVEVETSSQPELIEKASKLILPGVGSFDLGMRKLNESGVAEILQKKVLVDKIPILGICLGVQLMTKGSEEGVLPGLGWFDAQTIKFRFTEEHKRERVPHMGWRDTIIKKQSKLFNLNDEEYRYYYVHSYHLLPKNEEDILTTARYGYEFVSGLEKDNMMGLQFHPEKSHKYGMRVFKNFINDI